MVSVCAKQVSVYDAQGCRCSRKQRLYIASCVSIALQCITEQADNTINTLNGFSISPVEII